MLYLNGENGQDEMKTRLERMGFTNWENFRLLSEIRTILGNGTESMEPFNIDAHWDLLIVAVESFKPDWVIVDPLVAFHSRNEIKASEMRALMTKLLRLAEQKDLAVTLVQHPNMDYKAPDELRVRGSGDIPAAARAVIFIKPDDREPDRRLFVQPKLTSELYPRRLPLRSKKGA